jgi:hypothetical protein
MAKASPFKPGKAGKSVPAFLKVGDAGNDGAFAKGGKEGAKRRKADAKIAGVGKDKGGRPDRFGFKP